MHVRKAVRKRHLLPKEQQGCEHDLQNQALCHRGHTMRRDAEKSTAKRWARIVGWSMTTRFMPMAFHVSPSGGAVY